MFTLTINLGNDAMSSAEDVATELRRAADLLDEGYIEGPLMDRNGNRVGYWEFKPAADTDNG